MFFLTKKSVKFRVALINLMFNQSWLLIMDFFLILFEFFLLGRIKHVF